MLVVVPFRAGGKSRLPADVRGDLALAMLGDVLETSAAFAPTRLVTDDGPAALVAADLGVEVVADPGGGQGRAVAAGLAGVDGPCLVLNADLPGARFSDLTAMALAVHAGAVALVAAVDGTTNALGMPFAEVFRPLYGPGSAARFRAHAAALDLSLVELTLPNLRDDVDTRSDLELLGSRAGARTRALRAATA